MSLPVRTLTKTLHKSPTDMSSHSAEKVPVPTQLPTRQSTGASALSDVAVPDTDTRETSALLEERLRAWKHAVGYLEEYISATEKAQKAHAKEYEKVLKSIQDPLKEGSHFDQSLGGIAGLFENMRVNTESLANSHLETEKNLKGTVLPILERLHKEIKNKSKEISSGVGKAAKEIEKSRNTTQKHIELLGQQSAAAESSGSKVNSHDDPYITQRGIYYRLHKQILEENNNRQDLISVQENFAAFEHHVVEVIQQAMASFVQYVGGQVQRNQNAYTDMLTTVQRIPPDFEWNGFKQREADVLVDPTSAPRTIEGVTFPNQNHKSTQPLLEGTLERKSRNILSSGYSTGYYAITNALYLHGFKDNDNIRKDPEPEISIYLPDAVVGVPNGEKFHVKGKDVSKGFSSKLAGTSELNFKAHTANDAEKPFHTANDAEKWVEVIKMAAGANAARAPYSSGPPIPISPTTQKQASFGSIAASAPAAEAAQEEGVTTTHPTPLQIESSVTGGKTVASPTAVSPSATGAVVGTDKATK
ncbi:hypothetical protein V491_04007 [Pseudogymnoascus sp. VKM F-3775]|nr:hypothetical protein V491_04007 [Pseudogymnoascus sp. VKM F-3775]